MSTAAPTQAAFTADFVNPFIAATSTVFETMLGCSPNRTGLGIKAVATPKYELSAVIGVTGKATGTIVLSLSRQVALTIVERMVGTVTEEINSEVRDAVGELTNIIAGQAKAQLEHLELRIGIPSVVSGTDYRVHYPSDIKPIGIQFESEIGPFAIDVGFTISN